MLTSAEPARGRPSRPQHIVVALMLALVAVCGLIMQRQRAASRDVELDQAALSELTVVLSAAVQDDPHEAGTDVPVVLRNEGPHAMTVVTVRLDQPGYAAQPVDLHLAPAQNATVVLRVGPGCGPTVPATGPQHLRVVVQDTRGGRHELALATAPEMLDEQVLLRARRACGLLPLQEAVQPGAMSVQRVGDTVQLDTPLQDVGVLPLALVGVQPDQGLSVSTEPVLPVALRPEAGGMAPPARPLHIRLRVDDCRALARRPLLGQDNRTVVLRLRGRAGDVATTSLLPGREFDLVLNRLEQETCKLSAHGP